MMCSCRKTSAGRVYLGEVRPVDDAARSDFLEFGPYPDGRVVPRRVRAGRPATGSGGLVAGQPGEDRAALALDPRPRGVHEAGHLPRVRKLAPPAPGQGYPDRHHALARACSRPEPDRRPAACTGHRPGHASAPAAGRPGVALPRGSHRRRDRPDHGLLASNRLQPGSSRACPVTRALSRTQRHVRGDAIMTRVEQLLRQTLTGLADQGQVPSMGERALAGARRRHRRRIIASGVITIAVVLAMAAASVLLLGPGSRRSTGPISPPTGESGRIEVPGAAVDYYQDAMNVQQSWWFNPESGRYE